MSVSPYPRPGEPLAPALLKPLLHVPIPQRPEFEGLAIADRCFSDLDARVWARFPRPTCVSLGQAVIRQVAQSSYTLVRDHGETTLARPPRAFAVGDLPLEVRSINALNAQFGPLPYEPEHWARLSVRDLLEIPGFGAKSLVDFLCSYESFCDRGAHSADGEQARAHPTTHDEREQFRNWATDPSCPASKYLLGLKLPAPSGDWAMQSLKLQNRTANALRRNGLDRNPYALSTLTLRTLFAFPGFGEQSAKDLVAVLLQEPSATTRAVLPHSETLDEELRLMLACSLPRVDQRTIAVALRYLGLDGQGGGTLREVANAFGISRERVRQIVEQAANAIGRGNWDAPLLRRVVSAAGERLPRRAKEVEFDLRQKGLIAAAISLDRVALVADLVGHNRAWGLATVGGEAIVVPAQDEAVNRCSWSAWRRAVSNRESASSRA